MIEVRTRLGLAAACAIVALFAALAPSAASASSFTVGTTGGNDPSVEVNSGVAHVVWKANGADPTFTAENPNGPLEVCNLPYGATTCSSTATLVAPTTAAAGSKLNFATISNATYGAPTIVFDGIYLYVFDTYTIEGVSPTDNQDTLQLEWRSSDQGVTWTNPVAIGTFDNTLNSSVNSGVGTAFDATNGIVINGPWGSPGGVFGPYNVQANAISEGFPTQNLGSDPPGLETDQSGPDGAAGEKSDVTPFAALTLNPPATPGNGLGTVTSSIGRGGGSIVGVWDNAQNGYNFNYAYLKSGVAATAANIDDSSNWVTTHTAPGVNLSEASMAGDDQGLFLLEDSHNYPALSEWDQAAGTFTPEAEVDCGDAAKSGAGIQSENLYVSGDDGLQLVYSTSTNFVSTLKYSYLLATPHGYLQNYPVNLDSGSEYHELRVADDGLGADPKGIVVWDDPALTGTPIKAVWLPTPTPAGTTYPACKNPVPPATKPTSVKRTVSGLHVTVSTPAACDKFDSKVPFKIASTGKLTKGTKINKVEFFVGKGLKRKTGKGRRRRTIYLPNLTTRKIDGTHLVNTGGKGETGTSRTKHQALVHVVFVVKVSKTKRIVMTKSFTITVPFDICLVK